MSIIAMGRGGVGESPFFQRFTMIDHPYEIVRIRMISKATTEIFRSHFVALRRCFGLRSVNTRRKSLSDGTAPAALPPPLPLRPRPCPRSDPTPLPAAAFVCTLRVGTAECRLCVPDPPLVAGPVALHPAFRVGGGGAVGGGERAQGGRPPVLPLSRGSPLPANLPCQRGEQRKGHGAPLSAISGRRSCPGPPWGYTHKKQQKEATKAKSVR